MSDKPEAWIRHFFDLSFTVVAVPHSHWVEYTIYDIELVGNDGRPLWHKAGAPCSPCPVKTLEEAEPYLHGTVKWDGCSNWHFDEQERVMLHCCSREELLRFSEVMARCWDWTAELCQHWEGIR